MLFEQTYFLLPVELKSDILDSLSKSSHFPFLQVVLNAVFSGFLRLLKTKVQFPSEPQRVVLRFTAQEKEAEQLGRSLRRYKCFFDP